MLKFDSVSEPRANLIKVVAVFIVFNLVNLT